MLSSSIQRTIVMLLLLTNSAAAQNYSTVIEIVGGMEETMKTLVANEERARTQQIAELRSDISALRSALFRVEPGASSDPRSSEHYASAASVMDRLEQLEVRMNSSAAPSSEFQQLAGQLEQLVGELKKVIEDGKQLQQKPAAVPPPVYTFGGQIRHRGEMDGRSFVPDARTLAWNLLRTRFTVNIAPNTETKIFLQLQDSRTFGAGNPALTRGANDGMSKNIEFHQAYFSLSSLFGVPLSLRLGRQEIAYGNQRLMAAAGWNNVGQTFDALTATYSGTDWSADGFSAKLVGSLTSTNAENISGLYGRWKYFPAHSADGFLFYDNNTTPLTKGADKGAARLGRTTSGLVFNGKVAAAEYSVEGILQRGAFALTDSSARSDINAFLFAAGAGYLIDLPSKFRIGVKFERLSGDDDPKGGEYTVFNTLFTSTHSFLGSMDYFPKTFTDNGVNALSLSASSDLSSAVNLAVELFRFTAHREAAVKLKDGSVYRSFDLGYEGDVTATYKYSSGVAVNGGISLFLPEGAMRASKGSAVSYWGFLMTTVSF